MFATSEKARPGAQVLGCADQSVGIHQALGGSGTVDQCAELLGELNFDAGEVDPLTDVPGRGRPWLHLERRPGWRPIAPGDSFVGARCAGAVALASVGPGVVIEGGPRLAISCV
jgi:hypothetical protein